MTRPTIPLVDAQKGSVGVAPASQSPGHQPSASALREEWRACPWYEGLYEVSSLGRIRSRYAVNGHCLSTAGTDKDGYPVVSLSAPDGRHTYALHRLICRAFHGEPAEGHEVDHIDFDRTNAAAENLRWVTRSHNNKNRRRHNARQPAIAKAGAA